MTGSVFRHAPDWVYRVLKLSPLHYHWRSPRWDNRTYPCSRWWCFRRSPAWRAFERGGKSWCDRHVPGCDCDRLGRGPSDECIHTNPCETAKGSR